MYSVIDITISGTCDHYYAICNTEEVSEVTEVIEKMIEEAENDNFENDDFFDNIIDFVTSNYDCTFPDVNYIFK